MPGGSRHGGVALRTALSLVAMVIGTGGALLPVSAAPAYAAGCEAGGIRAGDVAVAVPWAQQRLASQRLVGLADGAGQLVGVVDSGVDARHPQLAGAVSAGYDGLDPGGDGQLDCVGHGTAVASIIAARPVSGVAFQGLAPAARILPIRISEQQTIGGEATGRAATMRGLAQSITYAVDHNVTVLNLSLVTSQDDEMVRQAVAYAVEHDVVVVAAAGNAHGQSDPTPYPAAYPGVIGVGAIGQDGSRFSQSQVGTYVDLVAPGDDVIAAMPGHGHARYSGTSFAAPFVTATAALVRQRHPELTAAQVAARLTATADPPDPGNPGSPDPITGYGAGVVNPYRAVTAPIQGGTERAAITAQAHGTATPVATRTIRTKALAIGIAGVGGSASILFVIGVTALSRWGRGRARGRRQHGGPELRARPARVQAQAAQPGYGCAGSTKSGA
jgi:membrane-anchored mycosin MYCP